MEIQYPDIIKCPYCDSKIRINYSNDKIASTEDLFAFNLVLPYSFKSAIDARTDNQNVKSWDFVTVICNHCKTILANNFTLP